MLIWWTDINRVYLPPTTTYTYQSTRTKVHQINEQTDNTHTNTINNVPVLTPCQTLRLQTLRHRLPNTQSTRCVQKPNLLQVPCSLRLQLHRTLHGKASKTQCIAKQWQYTKYDSTHINPISVVSKLIEYWRNRGKHTQTQAGETRTTSYKITYH